MFFICISILRIYFCSSCPFLFFLLTTNRRIDRSTNPSIDPSVVESVKASSTVVCASVDPSLFASDACYGAVSAGPAEGAKAMLSAKGASFGPGVVVDVSTGLRTLTLSAKEGGETAVLDLTEEVETLRFHRLMSYSVKT